MSQNYYRENFEPKVGDLVRIRSYEDMKSEFGVNEHGHIPCALAFVPDMMCLEGIEFTITRTEEMRYSDRDSLRIYGIPEEYSRWSISSDMIEPVDIDDKEKYDSTEIESFLADIKIT